MPAINESDAITDDIVRQTGYFPEMFAGMAGPDAMALIAGQLDAQRKRKMGMWDPSVASGGNF
jgi:hypothetical protein